MDDYMTDELWLIFSGVGGNLLRESVLYPWQRAFKSVFPEEDKEASEGGGSHLGRPV